MLFKKLPRIAAILIVALLMSASLKAGTTDKTLIDTGSVKQQFDYVINKSTLYSEYRAVRAVWFNKLRSHALDSLQQLKADLSRSENMVASQSKTVDSLTASLKTTSEQLAQTTKEKDTLQILGIQIAKFKYNSLVAVIILGLLALLSFGFLAFKRKNAIARQTHHDLNNLKEEFEMFRKRALEREQKMARRHLDEILKYKERSSY